MKRGQNAESIIPLVLIAILAIFVAAKFGIIDGSQIPLVGGLLGSSQTIKVGVVGHASSDIKNMLAAEDFRVQGMRYAGEIKQEVLYPGVLDSFDIIIIQGTQICDRTAREVIADKVKNGGKLVLIGDACTRVTDDPNAVGWKVGIGTLGDVVPASVGGPTHEREPVKRTGVSGKFKVIEQDHPMFNGIKNFGFNGNLVEVFPDANARVLAFVDESSSGKVTDQAFFAILESKSMLSGKVIYLAYDPTESTSRNMFLNMLLYMKGAKG